VPVVCHVRECVAALSFTKALALFFLLLNIDTGLKQALMQSEQLDVRVPDGPAARSGRGCACAGRGKNHRKTRRKTRTETRRKTHRKTHRNDFGPCNVPSGVLQMPSHGTLADWFSWHAPVTHGDISKAFVARTQGPAQERMSACCQPRLSFVHSESIKGFGRPKDGHATAPDVNVCGTPSRVLASTVGAAQKPAEHQKRVDKGACIDGRVEGRPAGSAKLQVWENTVEFWKKVRKGTLLPEASTATNDVHKIKFEYVPYTGLWWDTTMLNTELVDGILRSAISSVEMNGLEEQADNAKARDLYWGPSGPHPPTMPSTQRFGRRMSPRR
jgi:hypothetical protein